MAVSMILVSCSSDNKTAPIIKPQPGGGNVPSGPTSEIKVGEVLPAWSKGEMDIHFINTTTGECVFVIMPDGTQLLVDAASSLVKTNSNGSTTNTGIRSRWDPTLTGTRGSQLIGMYLKKCMAWTGTIP